LERWKQHDSTQFRATCDAISMITATGPAYCTTYNDRLLSGGEGLGLTADATQRD
jgi:pyrroline-5-carboxylate reductase